MMKKTYHIKSFPSPRQTHDRAFVPARIKGFLLDAALVLGLVVEPELAERIAEAVQIFSDEVLGTKKRHFHESTAGRKKTRHVRCRCFVVPR